MLPILPILTSALLCLVMNLFFFRKQNSTHAVFIIVFIHKLAPILKSENILCVCGQLQRNSSKLEKNVFPARVYHFSVYFANLNSEPHIYIYIYMRSVASSVTLDPAVFSSRHLLHETEGKIVPVHTVKTYAGVELYSHNFLHRTPNRAT